MDEKSHITLRSVFVSKDAYCHVASEFYSCHSKHLNLILHIIGASVQMWGAVHFLYILNLQAIVYGFATFVAITTPFPTAILHTALFGLFIKANIPFEHAIDSEWSPIIACIIAFGCGFLKDIGHHICKEQPYMGNYMKEKPYMFFFHVTWHLPFLIDAYLPFSTVTGLAIKTV